MRYILSLTVALSTIACDTIEDPTADAGPCEWYTPCTCPGLPDGETWCREGREPLCYCPDCTPGDTVTLTCLWGEWTDVCGEDGLWHMCPREAPQE